VIVAAMAACHSSAATSTEACMDGASCADAGSSNPPGCPAATGTSDLPCGKPCPEAGLNCTYEQGSFAAFCVPPTAPGDGGPIWGCGG
jgi:hypothetical protein